MTESQKTQGCPMTKWYPYPAVNPVSVAIAFTNATRDHDSEPVVEHIMLTGQFIGGPPTWRNVEGFYRRYEWIEVPRNQLDTRALK